MSDIVASSNNVSEANALKDEGNKCLSLFKYGLAIGHYSDAIALHPTCIFYSNRAQAHIKQESYGLAIADANAAIALDPTYIKAYYRRGSANFALGKSKLALKDFKAVAKIAPTDADAQKKLKLCEKVIKAEAFAAAIYSEDDDKPAVVDFESIVVESSYNGPRLGDDGEITMDFVHDVIERFKSEKLIHKKYVAQVLMKAMTYFEEVPTLQHVAIPTDPTTGEKTHFTVCGDTHGQFYDVCNIFALGGFPSPTNPYLFNGDYVDRGSFSFEVIFMLLTLKLACPTGLYMQRGNHETKNMNKIYGFEGEVNHKYDVSIMKLFTSTFNVLPLCCVIEDSVLVVHGGLSTADNVMLSDISAIRRGREPPESGLMSELLWSDPQPELGKSPSKRGVGFSFGPDITAAFLERNNLSLLIRSHEVKEEGYVVEHNGKCITIFSAPNYCDQMGNYGAFIRFESDMVPKFTKFAAVPHPNVPPMRYSSLYGQFGL